MMELFSQDLRCCRLMKASYAVMFPKAVLGRRMCHTSAACSRIIAASQPLLSRCISSTTLTACKYGSRTICFSVAHADSCSSVQQVHDMSMRCRAAGTAGLRSSQRPELRKAGVPGSNVTVSAQRRRKSSLGMPAMTEEELEAGRRLPQRDPPGWHGGGEGSRFDSQGRPRSFEDSMQWPVGHKTRDSSRSGGSNNPSSSVIASSAAKSQSHSQETQVKGEQYQEDVRFETEEERWAFQTASDDDSEDSGSDDDVVRTRHGRPSKTASKKSAKQQLEAAQQLMALPPGRLKQLLPELDEATAEAVLLARSLKRGRGKQRQIALVAKMLRQIGGKQMVTQQNRIGRAAAGKDSGGSTAAAERLALAWRDALTSGTSATSIAAADEQKDGRPGPQIAASASQFSGNGSSRGGQGTAMTTGNSGGSVAEADVAEQGVYAACVAMAAVPEAAHADFAEIRMLVRQVRQEQEAEAAAGTQGRKSKGRGRTRSGRRLLVWLRTLAATSLQS